MIKDALLPEFDHEIAVTRKLLTRIPQDKLAWKPHAKSMSLGEIGSHMATLPRWADAVLNRPFFDQENIKTEIETDAAGSILATYDASAHAARACMEKTDAEYLAPWSFKRGGQELYNLPRVAALRAFLISHLVHHRGQLSVYLRLNDIPVPPIYGPSADEG